MTTLPTEDQDMTQDAIVASAMIRVFDLCDLVLSWTEAIPRQPLTLLTDFVQHEEDFTSMHDISLSESSSQQASPPTQNSNALGTFRLTFMLKQLELNFSQAKMSLMFLAQRSSQPFASSLMTRSADLQKRFSLSTVGIYDIT